MRGNGLSAEEYVAVADLDPSTADLLLVRLRDRGVAAYAAESPDPAPIEIGTVDRLYVDVAAVEQARALIDVELSAAAPLSGGDYGPDGFDHDAFERDVFDGPADDQPARDFDAEFASIVASFDAPAREGRPAWPVEEDFGHEPRGEAGTEQPPPPAADDGADQSAASAAVGWDDLLRPVPPAEPEPEEGYVPPPPPPLPQTDAATRFAWAGVLGGPALLFLAVMLGWHLESWMMLAAAVAFLAGFVALVARLGDREDDGDDGAVV